MPPPDGYKVEVLYLLNPHLIWVGITDPAIVSDVKYDVKFEQIGIYGVLPLETTIDLGEGITVQPCQEWLKAAAALMREYLDDEDEVWFIPIYLDRRSSIFDENIHKFGDLLIQKTNGKYKSLSKVLKTSGFAIYNVCLFHQHLCDGKISTKLNNIETEKVVTEIKKYYDKNNILMSNVKWENSLKKQTSVFRATHVLEKALTTSNLEIHNNNIKTLLENKCKDLELCKGFDEVSMGRGTSRKKKDKKQPTLIQKKLQLLNSNKHGIDKTHVADKTEYEQEFEETKVFLESNAKPYSKKISSKADAQKSQILMKVMAKTAEKVSDKEQLVKRLLSESKELRDEMTSLKSSDSLSGLKQTDVSENLIKDKNKIKKPKSISKLSAGFDYETDTLHDNIKLSTMIVDKLSKSITDQEELNKVDEFSTSNLSAKNLNNHCHRHAKGKDKRAAKSEIKTSMSNVSQTSSNEMSIATNSKSKSPKLCAYQTQKPQRDQRVPDLPTDCEQFKSQPVSKHLVSKLMDQFQLTGSNYSDMIQKAISKCKDGLKDNKEAIEALNECSHMIMKENIEMASKISDPANHCLTEEAQPTKTKLMKKKEERKYKLNARPKVIFGPPGIDPSTICRVPPITDLRDDYVNLNDKANAPKDTELKVNLKLNRDKATPSVSTYDSKNNRIKQENKTEKGNDNDERIEKEAVSSHKDSVFEKRVKSHKEITKNRRRVSSSSSTTNKDSSEPEDKKPAKTTTKKRTTDDESDDNISDEIEKFAKNDMNTISVNYKHEKILNKSQLVVKANPFQNYDPSMSVFVDKLTTPIMMVHSKMNKRFEPNCRIRDVYFNDHIWLVLKNLRVNHPMMIQTIAWPSILRGYSVFMIGAAGSGKTMGYLPAVCRLVTDGCETECDDDTNGPLCIIVCATSQSVSEIEAMAKMLVGCSERVVSCYYGYDELAIATSLLNGCDLLICTAPSLVRLLQMTDFGVDLRRLATFVLEDCERLSEVYLSEVKICLFKIREMLKARVNKELKVQFVVASRIWCDFMEPLAKKAPDTVVCIGAFQECLLYSKANTTVSYVQPQNKLNHLLEFLQDADPSKRTVVVCGSDQEVDFLHKALNTSKYYIFASNSGMNVQALYNLSKSWEEFRDPMLAPVLICLDSCLYHMNVSDAHYLVQYSMPLLYSTFCRRFATLTESYPSIFRDDKQALKILILLSEGNSEQFPKIVNFMKRCTDNVPDFLDDVCAEVGAKNNAKKAESFVPLCSNLLSLGYCPDFHCIHRHMVHNCYDKPKEWMPTSGEVTFNILHYHSASHYSARLIMHIDNGSNLKYPPTYSRISLKMGVYYSNSKNRILLGIPKVGDVCAAALSNNLFSRCKVIKIIDTYQGGNPKNILVDLLDDEIFKSVTDTDLYYLPDDLKDINTYVVQVRLACIQPRDKDIVFSKLAKNSVKHAVNEKEGTYMKGRIALTVGNCIFVDTLEACQDLRSLSETVVTYNVKRELLEKHAEESPDHLNKILKICNEGNLEVKLAEKKGHDIERPMKDVINHSWAYLDEDFNMVDFGTIEDPDTIFMRLTKFEECMRILITDIQKYVAENTVKLTKFIQGDIVLAEYPDDCMYERARIDEICDENIMCFFVDQGEWRHLTKDKFIPISDSLVTQLPFQTIECRLVGIKPPGHQWSDFATNWLIDKCAQTASGDTKQLFVKYFTKETAKFTGGHKYGVVLIDTYDNEDLNINQAMIDLNLAKEVKDEIEYLYFMKLKNENEVRSHDDDKDDDSWERLSKCSGNSIRSVTRIKQNKTAANLLFAKPIRSVPLVGSDDESDDSDKWNINMTEDMAAIFKPIIDNCKRDNKPKLPALESEVCLSGETEGIEQINVENLAKNMEECSRQFQLVKLNPNSSKELDSDDLSSSELGPSKVETVEKTVQIAEDTQLRKPKLNWRQTKTSVMVKIQLIGAEEYNLEIQDRSMSFTATVNETEYGFAFDLYAVVDSKAATHSNKGQYILVKFNKIMKKNWLTLTKDGGIRKWIVYDVDSIDMSSDEEEAKDENLVKAVKNMHYSAGTDSSDDDFVDDVYYKS